MLKSYFKTALRNLRKHKAHSLLNITGLSVGMAVAMLIGLWIWDELSFNQYHAHYDRIAQVMQQKNNNGSIATDAVVPLPLEAELRKNYGNSFKHIVLSSWSWRHVLTVGDKNISYTGSFMGAEAPELFSLKMLKGSRNGLRGPSSMLISQSVATALFGEADPIGKVIKLDNDNNASFKVAGVYEDLPYNTTLHDMAFMAPWDYYASAVDWVRNARDNWGDNSFELYVQVADNADMKKVSESIRNSKLNRVSAEDAKFNPVIFLHPMRKWHLYSTFENGVNTGGAIEYVWLFGIIGMFVLLLACINFMNLSTARSEKRAKEVGIRKAVGSLRMQLITQFFCESVLMAFAALGFALLLVWLALPFFNQVADKKMTLLWGNPFFWLMCIAFTLFTGLIAGSYPALYLSSFKPVKVLKGSFKAGRLAAVPRKVLVVLQFTVSIVLIIGTVIVFRQIQFAKNRPIGYGRDGLMDIEMTTGDLFTHFNAVRTELLQSGVITEMAVSSSPVTALHNTRGDLDWKGKDPSTTYDFGNVRLTSGFGKTVNWQLAAGRDFSSEMPTDSSAVILNETAVKYMGFKKPVGEIIRTAKRALTVIGVVKDMVMQSPYEPVKPSIFVLGSPSFDNFDDILIKINPRVSAHEAIRTIAAVCKTYSPTVPFTYKFADEEYAKKFRNEERIGQLAGVFAALAIFISCLGLFGMAAFMAEQRVKEIGVRKVLGASVLNLWGLLSKDFIVLVVIALFIATPVGYYCMHNWLQHYEYRTEITWWVFAAAGLSAILITLATVSYQSIKAALMNPVNSLRSE